LALERRTRRSDRSRRLGKGSDEKSAAVNPSAALDQHATAWTHSGFARSVRAGTRRRGQLESGRPRARWPNDLRRSLRPSRGSRIRSEADCGGECNRCARSQLSLSHDFRRSGSGRRRSARRKSLACRIRRSVAAIVGRSQWRRHAVAIGAAPDRRQRRDRRDRNERTRVQSTLGCRR
jgi:hypothetical protein